jgi:glycine cleavage system H protein
MNVPDDLRYTSDHEWARLESGLVRIGITDYAQDALGDVVFVQLPEPGVALDKSQSFSEVESTKSVSEVYAPLAGTVHSVNTELADAPQHLNEDPYGSGWICIIQPADPAAYDALMTPEQYRELIAD